jgi:AcrR family transcriptional regulator
MLSSMGRPREHDEQTAAALLTAAERTIQIRGLESLSVRRLAGDVGTTTRAIYSLFGSKEGLIGALGAHAFDLLRHAVVALPTTDDPAEDLIEAGMVFRRFAIEHPSLFSIGVQRNLPSSEIWERFRSAASSARAALEDRLARLAERGLLGRRTVTSALCEFHALCEGLAAMELRGTCPPEVAEQWWREGLGALVAGFAMPVRAGLPASGDAASAAVREHPSVRRGAGVESGSRHIRRELTGS